MKNVWRAFDETFKRGWVRFRYLIAAMLLVVAALEWHQERRLAALEPLSWGARPVSQQVGGTWWDENGVPDWAK